MRTGASRTAHLARAVTNDDLNRGLKLWLLGARRTGGGSRWWDLSPTRAHGTLTNGPTWRGPLGRPGGFGTVNFDGADDFVDVNPAAGLSNSQVSIVFWGRPAGVTADQYAAQGYDGSGTNKRAVILGFQDGFWNVFNDAYPTGTAADTQIAATANAWQQVAFVSDGSTLQGYLNGVQQYSRSANLNVVTFLQRRLGSASASNYYAGALDCWREYARALSADEVYALHADDLAGHRRTLETASRQLRAVETASPGEWPRAPLSVILQSVRRRRRRASE